MSEFIPGLRGSLIHAIVALVGWQLLDLADNPALAILIAQVVPRAAVVTLAGISRPAAKSSIDLAMLSSGGAVLAILQGLLAAAFAGWLAGTLILVTCYMAIRLTRAWAYRSSGGIHHVSLAYAWLAVEVSTLAVLALNFVGQAFQPAAAF
jgi:fucose permease